ncbi:helix-turn-helix domain-containing protein [Streptomyces sp. H27-G5]|uniref:PucR family transcriptional regulator n=1 Tax=Streptomyces sp. H27-G5 TaxID=2996698 RepID=UPI0022709534|nr:helix-turn-helix domain-containing protein [Streptomyces sp. H27-G5]MCY0923739.1 helix-turn-helix domain-containing protein [Streptomyces sp. H27-G5]
MEVCPINDSKLVRQLKARRDITVSKILDMTTSELPKVAQLHAKRPKELPAELQFVTVRMLDMFDNGQAPFLDSDLEVFRNMGSHRCLFDSFSASDVRDGFEVGHLAGLRDILSVANSENYGEFAKLIRYGAQENARLIGAAMAGYHDTARVERGETLQARRQLLAEVLRASTESASMAAAAGILLPEGYLILVCRFLQEEGALARALDESRSLLRSSPGILWSTQAQRDEMMVLLPVNGDEDAAQALSAELVTAASRKTRSVRAAHAVAATLGSVPDTLRELQQTMSVVVAMPDAQARPYTANELVIELAISRQPALQERLVDLLGPLDQGTDLRLTLDALFFHELDREKTAKALNIHRRTLSYRLQRIRDFSGLDPSSPHGIQLLRAAMTAANLSSSGIDDFDPHLAPHSMP